MQIARKTLVAACAAAAAIQGIPAELPGEWTTFGARPPSRVLTLLDYFESGQQAVDVFLRESPAAQVELSRTLDALRWACVRIEVRFGGNAQHYRSLKSSGVLVDEGRRVLTAGHVVEGAEDYEVVVTLLDGQSRTASLLERAYDPFGGPASDRALLEIQGEPFPPELAVETAAVHEQELAIVMGYPDGIGVDRYGKVAFSAIAEGEYLAPLVTLATVIDAGGISLRPRAGSVPTGGMSGAPVFDARGRLIGIFVSVSKLSGRSFVSYTYNAAPLSPPGR